MPPRINVKDEPEQSNPESGFSTKQIFSVVGVAAALLFLIVALHSLVDTNPAGFIKVRQAAYTGKLTAITQPGVFPRLFGDVTTYKVADILYFSKHEDEGKASDDSIVVKFNDGATAHITGNVRIELPQDPQKILDIHRNFRSYDSLIKDTVKQVVSEATILTAALMTAEESYTTKRAEFSQLADDQVRNGVYLTESHQIDVKDPKTGEIVSHNVVRIQRDENGQPLRKESPFTQYGIKVTQFVVKDIDYEKTVDDQIQTKQQALMQVVASKAQAEKAIQERLTAEEQGKKNVAVAKYEQEVKKATAVTQAEQELEVAKLARAAAEQNKAAMILKGEGEGEYRRKLMVADGALDKKLEAYVETQKAWAEAVAKSEHPLVPSVVFGGGQGGTNNAGMTMMDIIAIKAAKDLAVDVGAKKQTPAQKDDDK